MNKYQNKVYKMNHQDLISKDGLLAKSFFLETLINDQEDDNLIKEKEQKERVKDINTCVRFGTCFANLISMVDLAQESDKETNDRILKKIKKDLKHLHQDYKIVHRENGDNWY